MGNQIRNSRLSYVRHMLRCSRFAILVRALEPNRGVTVAEVADAAIDLSLDGSTVGALVRALRDGEGVITVNNYNLASVEKHLVSTALAYAHDRSGSLADVATELGVTVPILQKHMRRHGLRWRASPPPPRRRP